MRVGGGALGGKIRTERTERTERTSRARLSVAVTHPTGVKEISPPGAGISVLERNL
jgi:hypothetical protein